MTVIYVSEKVMSNSNGGLWYSNNGRTRQHLIFRLGRDFVWDSDKATSELRGELSPFTKGKHTYLFLNKARKKNRVLGVFLCSSYGYTVVKGKELFTDISVGGYGNSESRFGVYEVGTVIEKHTYKNRTPATYYELKNNGWAELGEEYLLPEEAEEMVEL